MVINLGFLKSGRYQDVEHEIRQIKQAIGGNILKVIIETCYLTEDEKRALQQNLPSMQVQIL
jgi:deoxyribose-phosphate aldolase